MKVAVTGSNGLVGQKLVYLLKQESDIDLITTGRGANRLINKDGYKYYSLDLNSQKELADFFRVYQPDVLINPAAITQIDYCENNKEECYQINTVAVQWIIELCEEYSTRLIHFSTDFVFDGENGPYKEDDRINPISYYGKCKAASENLVKNSGLKNWNIIRTVLVYGITDNMSRSNFVLWVKNSLEKNEKINVVNDQIRTPTLAEDLAVACKVLLKIKENGVFHISGNETVSIIGFANKIAEVFKLKKELINPIHSASLNQPAERPPVTGFNIDKAMESLRFSPKSIEEGLAYVSEQIKSGKFN